MGTAQKNSCKTAAVMGLLGKGPAPGQDLRVLPEQPRDIEVITQEILDAVRSAGENILIVGRGLIEAKAQLSHGEWLLWLEKRVSFSEATAQNYMKLARRFSNPETFRDLGYSKALVLLALPEDVMEEYIEAPHVVNGEAKTVGDMSVRELKAAIKARDEALRAAELARAEQSAAEQAREKMAQDMAAANERIAGLNAEVEEQSARVKAAQEEAARLERELSELRSRPADVAVEVDEAAVEAARREAEERMRAQVDEAKAAHKAAEASLKELNGALQRAEQGREQAEAELRRQLARAEKKAVISADADMVLFDEIYDQTQILFNQMGGVRLKKLGKEPEKAEKLQTAMMALIPILKEAAGCE